MGFERCSFFSSRRSFFPNAELVRNWESKKNAVLQNDETRKLGNPQDSVWEDRGTLGKIRGITTRDP